MADDEQSSWTMDDEYRASHPGGLRLVAWWWFLNAPRVPILLGFLTSAFVGGAVFVSWLHWIPAAGGIIAFAWYWLRWSEHFRHGNVVPGVVIHEDPRRIAVSTDLTQTEDGSFSVVLVAAAPRGLRTAAVGTRFPAVAIYGGVAGRPRWERFYPVPAALAVRDAKDIARCLASIDAEDWLELRSGVSRLAPPFAPGLYALWEDEVRVLERPRRRMSARSILGTALVAGLLGLMAWGFGRTAPEYDPDAAEYVDVLVREAYSYEFWIGGLALLVATARVTWHGRLSNAVAVLVQLLLAAFTVFWFAEVCPVLPFSF